MSAPIVEGVTDDLPADRASASIGGEIAVSAAPEARSTRPVTQGWPQIQRWFSGVITHPASVSQGLEAESALAGALGAARVEDLVTPSARLSARDRLAIYHHGYKARLVECVREDFRVLALALPRFAELAGAYVDAHPSRSWNLVPYAEGLPSFLSGAAEPLLEPLGRALATDLARLEWAMVEVSHAPIPPPLDLSRLASASPEEWARLRFEPSPALRILALGHPLLELYRALASGAAHALPAPREETVATWRQHGRVWRMSLTPATSALLSALLEGAALGDALEAVSGTSEDVMRWFSEWVSCGFFAAISAS